MKMRFAKNGQTHIKRVLIVVTQKVLVKRHIVKPEDLDRWVKRQRVNL